MAIYTKVVSVTPEQGWVQLNDVTTNIAQCWLSVTGAVQVIFGTTAAPAPTDRGIPVIGVANIPTQSIVWVRGRGKISGALSRA